MFDVRLESVTCDDNVVKLSPAKIDKLLQQQVHLALDVWDAVTETHYT